MAPLILHNRATGERLALRSGARIGRGVLGLRDKKLSRHHSQLHDYQQDGWEINPLGKNALRVHHGSAPVQVVEAGRNFPIAPGDRIVFGRRADPERDRHRTLWVELAAQGQPEPEPAGAGQIRWVPEPVTAELR